MIPPPPSRSHRFSPPPGWPPPPPGWVPPTVPWDAGPSLPPAPENWQWWIGPTPHRAVQQGNSGVTWWRSQTRAGRKLITTAVVFILGALILPHSSWFLNWHNNLTGGTFDVSQAHSYCSNPLVQAVTVPGSTQANDCATAADWSTFFTLLLVTGFVLLAIAAYKIYKQHGTGAFKPPAPRSS
jgi:hypothetical protein